MRTLSSSWLILALLVATLPTRALCAKPTWTFRVLVAVDKQTADYFQNAYAKPIDQLVKEQMATVNANFNSAAGFKGTYRFQVDSIYVFSGYAGDEINRPHPGFTYAVVIDGGFSGNTLGGGWLGDQQVIYHKWTWNYFDGPFAQYATDGLTHEFGHARGAVDLYGVQVDASKNPVNNTAFAAVNSIMNYPYGNIVWDDYTTHLLNSTADSAIVGDAWITKPFPTTIGIKTLDYLGNPLSNVTLDLYPVEWFSNSLTATPILTNRTGTDGQVSFTGNPFQPTSQTSPWHIRYPNFLVKATYNSVVMYAWMPFYDTQNTYFNNGPNSAYIPEIQFPKNATPPQIIITGTTPATACSPGTMAVSFTTTAPFDTGNQFTILLVNRQNMATTFGTFQGTSGTTVTASVPFPVKTGPDNYSLIITSSQPSMRSAAFPVTFYYTPTTPGVQSLSICQNASVLSLSATGTNLLWYRDSTGSTGVTVAPVLSTSLAGRQVYYVSQTLNGCESARAVLAVTVNPLPSAPTVAPLDLCQQTAPQSVSATGSNLSWYNFDGQKLSSAPIVYTDLPTSYTFLVSQTLAGCEGPQATLVVSIHALPTADLSGSQTIVQGQSATVSIALTGEAPWTILYYDSTRTGAGQPLSIQTSTSPYSVSVQPALTTFYRLRSVSNSCGLGTVGKDILQVYVNPLLGIDDPFTNLVEVFPVPTTSILTIRASGVSLAAPASFILTNLQGQPLVQQVSRTESTTLSLDACPAGNYILQIRVGDRATTRHIVKQ